MTDRTVLRLARARVSAALADRVSTVAERAAATLDLALSVVGPAAASARLVPAKVASDPVVTEVPRW